MVEAATNMAFAEGDRHDLDEQATNLPRLLMLHNMKDYTCMLPHVCNLSISKTMLTGTSKLIATSDDH